MTMSEPSAESLERARAFIDAHNPIVSYISARELARIFDTIREEERERCAKIADQQYRLDTEHAESLKNVKDYTGERFYRVAATTSAMIAKDIRE